MAVIGNDNYRPGLSPPKPLRVSAGWLSSNMAQLMVFINGIIFTIVAFSIINIFIAEIINDRLDKTTRDIEERIIEEYSQAEEILRSTSYILDLSSDLNEASIQNYISNLIEGETYFYALYVLEKKNGTWQTKDLYFAPDFQRNIKKSSNTYRKKLEEEIISVKKKSDFSARFPLQGIIYRDDLGVYAEPYLISIPIGNEGDKYLIGLGRSEALLPTKWISDKSTVKEVRFFDAGADAATYIYRAPDYIETNDENNISKVANLILSEGIIEVRMSLGLGPREAFLRKIPFLMLLFGFTLTLIGTMYVRNNQKQSLKLAEMNKELAHKNYELSQQMSERERLNTMMRKSARDNAAVINAVSDIIFELSVDEKIIFLNNSWKKVTGFNLEQSVGRNLFDLLYYQDQEEQKDNFLLLVKGQKKPYRAYTRLRTSDGTFRAVELTMSMIRQDENKDLRVVGTIVDVEERRRAERALSEAEKKYRAIVENAASGIYQVTPEGQYLSANPALAKILGYERPENVLSDIANVTEEVYVDQGAREKILREIKSSKSARLVEFKIKRKDGTIFWANEHIRPVYDDEDNLIFYEGSIEDIDQRKKAELALREAKVESDLANRSKSEFLANIGHELRTPLNSIIGFSEIIKDQAFGKIKEEKYLDYAENIYESGHTLLKSINEILDISRIEAGDRGLYETHVNTSDILSSTLMLYKSKLKNANIEVYNRTEGKEFGLIAEAQAIKQMYANIISNTIKFKKGQSGTLTIDSDIIEDGSLHISFTDTGVGLTEDEIEKALSPFGQIDTDHNRGKSGTGLGLTLVKSLMRLHGGSLEMVSQKGIGTTVTLVFPETRVTKTVRKGKNAVADNLESGDILTHEEITDQH